MDCLFHHEGKCLLSFNPCVPWGNFQACESTVRCWRGVLDTTPFRQGIVDAFVSRQRDVYQRAEPAMQAIWQNNAQVYLRDNDRGCCVPTADNKVIAESYYVERDPLLALALSVFWADDDILSAEQYMTCDSCNNAVRTEPDGYGWRADYWLDADSGCGPICGDCIRTDRTLSLQYLDWCAESSRRANTILTAGQMESLAFTLLVKGLEHGMMGGQCDDPKPIRRYIKGKGLLCVFDLYPGQFDAIFDVWVSSPEHISLSENVLLDLRTALLRDPENWADYPSIRPEFRADRDPADVIKEGLERASRAGSRFSRVRGDGSVITYESLDAMMADQGTVLD